MSNPVLTKMFEPKALAAAAKPSAGGTAYYGQPGTAAYSPPQGFAPQTTYPQPGAYQPPSPYPGAAYPPPQSGGAYQVAPGAFVQPPDYQQAPGRFGQPQAYQQAPSGAFQPQPVSSPAASDGRVMTLDGVIMKTGGLFVVLLAAGVLGWWVPVLMLVGLVGGLVLGFINAFRRKPSPVLVLLYGAFEGLLLGGLSSFFEAAWSGIVLQAVAATLGVFAVVLVLFKVGRFRLTSRGAKILIGCMFGYMICGLINLLFVSTGMASNLGMYSATWNGIPIGSLISLFAITLGAFSLVMDFQTIEAGIQARAPERMEWSAAFGLAVTLIWLYIEILRLLARSRN